MHLSKGTGIGVSLTLLVGGHTKVHSEKFNWVMGIVYWVQRHAPGLEFFFKFWCILAAQILEQCIFLPLRYSIVLDYRDSWE